MKRIRLNNKNFMRKQFEVDQDAFLDHDNTIKNDEFTSGFSDHSDHFGGMEISWRSLGQQISEAAEIAEQDLCHLGGFV